MKTHIFRNYTVEHLFPGAAFSFSGYGDTTIPTDDISTYVLFYQVNPSATPEDQVREIEDIKSRVQYIARSLPATKRFLIFTLQHSYNRSWHSQNDALAGAITDFNEVFLKELKLDIQGVKVLDINSFFELASSSCLNWKFFFLSQMIIEPKHAKQFRWWYEQKVREIDLRRKKCIVLDCDNTLWGGIVGEDGVYGIKLGDDYPGLAFKKMQELLRMAASTGIILAVCSKNNEADVKELWQTNTNNILNEHHISCYKINWNDKATNIKLIAEELNIGLDSIVFFDDNSVERELVKGMLPDVVVPDFPAEPYMLVDFFWKVYNEYFSVYRLSDEDLNKTAQYKENLERSKAKNVFENIEDYWASLGIEIDIASVQPSTIARVAQMTQKTNQFNLTTKRYTEEDIRRFADDKSLVFSSSVKDKFGDNGITIAGIMRPVADGECAIDSYLLSCRILGRGVELAVLHYVMNSFYTKGVKRFKATYIPSAKNVQAADFYDKVGFSLASVADDGSKHYVLDMNTPFALPSYYTINAVI
jgi:FkbH-like protein